MLIYLVKRLVVVLCVCIVVLLFSFGLMFLVGDLVIVIVGFGGLVCDVEVICVVYGFDRFFLV